jgi:hypothetical protein
MVRHAELIWFLIEHLERPGVLADLWDGQFAHLGFLACLACPASRPFERMMAAVQGRNRQHKCF